MSGFKVLTQFDLKLIAVTTMLIDHIGMLLFPGILWLRFIGRIAFPIYCFLLTEGYKHTSSKTKYALRLGCFAVISEIPFDLAKHGVLVSWRNQNVFITLLLGLVIIWAYDTFYIKNRFLLLIIYILVMLAALGSNCDYEVAGVLMIFLFYILREKRLWQYLSFSAVNIVCFKWVQYFAIFSLIPISMYNGKKGKKFGKWFFYLFYPVHLLVLYLIKNNLG